jgi:hypothetical protein
MCIATPPHVIAPRYIGLFILSISYGGYVIGFAWVFKRHDLVVALLQVANLNTGFFDHTSSPREKSHCFSVRRFACFYLQERKKET